MTASIVEHARFVQVQERRARVRAALAPRPPSEAPAASTSPDEAEIVPAGAAPDAARD